VWFTIRDIDDQFLHATHKNYGAIRNSRELLIPISLWHINTRVSPPQKTPPPKKKKRGGGSSKFNYEEISTS